jgi:putative endonuclease
MAFSSEWQAAQFEKYLKSGSGQAFANKRLWCGKLENRTE